MFSSISIPTPLITNIKLESDNSAKFVDTSPYIDLDPVVSFVDNLGKIKYVPKLVDLSSIVKSTLNLKSTLELDVSNILKAVDDNDVEKYTRLVVFQSSDENSTAQIKSGKLSLDDIEKLQGVKTTTLSLTELKKTLDTSLSLNFSLASNEPDHLSFFATTYIDGDSLVVDKNLDASVVNIFNLQSDLVGETAIAKSIFQDTVRVFETDKGALWAGTTRKLSGKYFPVFEGKTLSTPLKFRNVKNNKLKDLRKQGLVKTQFSSEISAFQRNLEGLLSNSSLNPSIETLQPAITVVSDGMLARDGDGNCRAVFSVDFKELLKDLSPLGQVLHVATDEIVDLILKQTSVLSFRIYRTRMINDEDVFDGGDSVPELICFSADGVGGNLNPNSYIRTSLVEPVLVGAVRELDIAVDNKFLRTFTFIDDAMSEITDGLYRYSMQISLEDGIRLFLHARLTDIRKASSDLEQYYNLSLAPSNFDAKRETFAESFRGTTEKIYVSEQPWVTSLTLFFDTINLFGVFDVQKAKEVTQLLFSAISPQTGSPEGVGIFIDLLNTVECALNNAVTVHSSLNDQIRRGQSKFANSLMYEADLNTVFDSNVLKNVGYNFLGGTSDNKTGLRVITTDFLLERTEAENAKFLEPTVESKSEGLSALNDLSTFRSSYLSPAEVNLGNEKTVFTSLKKVEGVSTIFTPDVVSSKLSTKETLTKSTTLPTSDLILNKTMGSELGVETADKYKNVSLSIAALALVPSGRSISTPVMNTISSAAIKLPTATQVLQTKSTNLLSQSGVELSIAKSVSTVKASATTTNSGKVSSRDILGDSNFNTQGLTKPSTKEDDQISSINTIDHSFLSDVLANILTKTPDTLSLDDLDTSKDTNIITKEFGDSDEDVRKIPNQIKSLMIPGASKTKWRESGLNLTHDSDLSNIFKTAYLNLKQIDYLAGFEESTLDDHILVKKPIWKTITTAVIAAVGDQPLLCRLTRYSESRLKITELSLGTASQVPSYDEYFFLSKSPDKTPELSTFKIPLTSLAPASVDFVKSLDRTSLSSLSSKTTSKLVNGLTISYGAGFLK